MRSGTQTGEQMVRRTNTGSRLSARYCRPWAATILLPKRADHEKRATAHRNGTRANKLRRGEPVTKIEVTDGQLRPGGFLVFNDFAHIDPYLGVYGVHRAVVEFAVDHRWPFAWFAYDPCALYDVALRRPG
jgi:hypothetical protein